MSAAFQLLGKDWRPRITTARLRPLRELGLDLGGEPFDAIERIATADPERLVAAAYLLCEGQHPDVSPESFGGAVGGDELDALARALSFAVVDFFPRPAQRRAMADALTTWLKGEATPPTLREPAGSGPAPRAGSTPDPSPSAS